jgi:hydroxymethylglutaryl-CoA reductase (NADPH)
MTNHTHDGRRLGERFLINRSIFISVKGGKEEIGGTAISIGKGGICFRTEMPLQYESNVIIRMVLSEQIIVTGNVIQRDEASNIYRVKFDQFSESTEIIINNFLNEITAHKDLRADRRSSHGLKRILLEGLPTVSPVLSKRNRIVLSPLQVGQELEANLINLGQSGVCISSRYLASQGERIPMTIEFPDKKIALQGIVRWVRLIDGGGSLMGLEIESKKDYEGYLGDILFDLLESSFQHAQSVGTPPARKETETNEYHKEKIVRIPHDEHRDYDEDFIQERRSWLAKLTQKNISHLANYSISPNELRGNIENFLGVAQVPIGLVGPLKITGDYARGTFYVPLATTEGALISTYQRGAIAITKSGGARVTVKSDENYLDPVFVLKNLDEASAFAKFVLERQNSLREKVSEVTQHGKLTGIEPIIIGRRVILKVSFYTEDAMGANMINFATEAICLFLSRQFPVERYFLRSNYSSEKKAGGVNMTSHYGKEVFVEAIIPARLVRLYLHSSSRDIAGAWHSWALGSAHAGMLGINAQIANGLSGIFIACGQDVAHVTNASVGITMLEQLENGDLFASLKLPNIIVGTIGGGTGLGTQKECLEIIGCYGKGKAKKFAEIVGATLLAGELGICAGLTSEEFLAPHVRAAVHTKEKANRDSKNLIGIPQV